MIPATTQVEPPTPTPTGQLPPAPIQVVPPAREDVRAGDMHPEPIQASSQAHTRRAVLRKPTQMDPMALADGADGGGNLEMSSNPTPAWPLSQTSLSTKSNAPTVIRHTDENHLAPRTGENLERPPQVDPMALADRSADDMPRKRIQVVPPEKRGEHAGRRLT
jgi:hypothetical protein